ncbi:RagB/SusD family nutrient uptake outer membrane protein [Paraflavitalea sp. CAU 1676]|uniref:RagB/SusD family nutrient uptake outer membrane protein n=1 Tax=Paraflavitalea sp. CAU 1676 TaxID=3032598 RepID=UPI0023DA9DE5|nr:RagB/SusD family nutrient uptake outer membrane protein [Paraflavitalea sp. CAU 1676]MDF2187793.1 RagB/SusD family nutrient uptake outer membrane protein [Paraflavitalea sp. CAU 1676]
MKPKIFNTTIPATACVLLFALNLLSCKKYLALDVPPTAIGREEAFADSATATSVVLGIYSRMASEAPSTYNRTIFYSGMSSDEFYYFTNPNYDDIKNNTLTAGNNVTNFWQDLYARIGVANYAIEGVTASSLSGTLKNQLLGEARFWRAWLYFHLVNNWGAVPLVTSTDALTTSRYSRSPVSEVFKQIVADLTEAKSRLSVNYPSPERARINRHAASAFLARVYLYEKNWAAAEAEANTVIQSGTYSIVTNLNNVFLNTSSETILQLSLAAPTTPATALGIEFIPATATPNVVLLDTLARTFEPDDQRKVNWTKQIVFSGKTYSYPFKYKVRATTTGNEYPVVLRLAEVYLTRAEARANQDNITGAQDDLNIVRKRAGLGNTTAVDKTGMIAALEHERWVELFSEGDRWFNLKRLGIADAVLKLVKPKWKPHQQLYPLPMLDMTANPALTDNPGY